MHGSGAPTVGAACCAALLLSAWVPASAGAAAYPAEHIYDTTVGDDEALVNVVLANNRWPDCTTLESAI